jgi:hypothetical protein
MRFQAGTHRIDLAKPVLRTRDLGALPASDVRVSPPKLAELNQSLLGLAGCVDGDANAVRGQQDEVCFRVAAASEGEQPHGKGAFLRVPYRCSRGGVQKAGRLSTEQGNNNVISDAFAARPQS